MGMPLGIPIVFCISNSGFWPAAPAPLSLFPSTELNMSYRSHFPIFVASIAVAVSTVLSITSPATADDNTAWVAYAVEPKTPFEHGMVAKSEFETKQRNSEIVGPKFFSEQAKSASEKAAYFNWYAIENAQAALKNAVSVTDSVVAKGDLTIKLGEEAFLVTPAERISSGSPPPSEDWSQFMKAYKVESCSMGDKPLATISDSVEIDTLAGKLSVRGLQLAYVAVPCEWWHHDEYRKVASSSDRVLIYEIKDASKVAQTVTTIDEFCGLNSLRLSAARWICVRTSAN
jgi:hypothetical protein